MRKVYLHIGFGKTGSSSLQSYLSFNTLIQQPESNENLLYCSILVDGKIIFGDELKRRAKWKPLKYLASANSVANIEILDTLKSELDEIFKSGYTPIFSQENWWQSADNFQNTNFFNRLEILADVIIYVRPQVEWFNSAWWQWFAWEKSFKRPQDVIDTWGYYFLLWGSHISKWRSINGVQNITVRLQSPDIVEDFLNFLKISYLPTIVPTYRVNTSLPPILIKFLLKYPFLRSPHSSYIDIILLRFLKFEGKSPWIIDTELTQQIITATRLDNEKLLDMLDERSQEIMKNDPRWWDAEHYKNLYLYNEKDLELGWNELFSIIACPFRELLNLGKRLLF